MRLYTAVLLFAVFATTLEAQPAETPLPITGKIATAVPAAWKVIRSSPTRIDLAIPLERRKAPLRLERDNPKPIRPESRSLASMVIAIEPFADQTKALQRLAALAVERPGASTTIIGGFPAVERKTTATLPNIGDAERPSQRVVAPLVTTAIAIRNVVLHFETVVLPDAPQALVGQAIGIARRVTGPGGDDAAARRDLEKVEAIMRELRTRRPPDGGPRRTSRTPHSVLRRPGGHAGFAFANSGKGEIEVVAVDVDRVLIAHGNGYAISDDGAASFTTAGLPCKFNQCDSDPSVTIGKSGTLYLADIGAPADASTVITTWTNSVYSASGIAQPFTFVGDAVNCPTADAAPCFPDQEHIAADRWNAAKAGGDRLYVITSYSLNGFWNANLVCSSDSGVNWTSSPFFVDTNVIMPRVSVGRDGSVWVAYESGGNMMVRKYSDCDAGLTEQTSIYPLPVATFTKIPCPIAGLDRCNDGNVLESPTVAVDDLDAQHVYYAFATSTIAGNEDVMVYDSVDGGKTFNRSVRVNAMAPGRRFMPWLSAYDGNAIVTWYDRRNATTAAPDLTRFFGARAYVSGGSLVAGTDFDISTIDDPQCTNWPCAPRSSADATSCGGTQLAGICSVDPPKGCTKNADCGAGDFCMNGQCTPSSLIRCDFTAGCAGTAICQVSGGCPKYGDYNGNAVFGGRLFSAWASATPPPSITPTAAFGQVNVFATTSIIPSNYFVRDWTNSGTDHDSGLEPSTSDVFWYSGDVWNQSADVAQAPVDDWVAGDPPIRNGDNFAFARISRRSAAAPDAAAATVKVNFFISDYGASLPFSSIGSETVTLPAGTNSVVTPPHKWTVAEGASSHICLAVEIDETNDPVVQPGLAGNAPGPADPLILGDNNKAQRNLAETLTMTGSKLEWLAQVGNGSSAKQSLVLQADAGSNLEGTMSALGGAAVPIGRGTRLMLADMRPGERRWVRIRVTGAGDAARGLPAHFRLIGERGPFSGFSVRLLDRGPDAAAGAALREWAGVLTRIGALRQANEIRQMLSREGTIDSAAYEHYLGANLTAIRRLIAAQSLGVDRFELKPAFAALKEAVNAGNRVAIFSAHQMLTQRFDAFLTAAK